MSLKHNISSGLAAMVMVGLTTHAAHATFLIVNGSFEDPALPGTLGGGEGVGYSNDAITDWSGVSDFDSVFGVQAQSSYPDVYPGGIPDGNQYAYVNNEAIFQDIGTSVTAGTTYTLKGYVGVRTDDAGAIGNMALEVPGSVVASTGTVGSTPGTFTPYTVTFTPESGDSSIGQELYVYLSNFSGSQINFDDVSLTATDGGVTPTPEPSGLVLLSMGVLGVGLLLYRRRNLVATGTVI